MPFTVFVESTTAYANEVMDNFYTIAQGDRLPRGGANLDPTTGAYNIGSASYYWDEVYCKTVDISNSNKLETLVSRQILSAAAQSVEFLGLDDRHNYEIRLKYNNMAGHSTSVYLLLNSVTGTGISIMQSIVEYKSGSIIFASTYSSSISNIKLNYNYPTTTMDTASAMCFFSISPKGIESGSSTQAIWMQGWISGDCFDGATEWTYNVLKYLTADAGTLTSIKFLANTTTGIPINSIIELWKK